MNIKEFIEAKGVTISSKRVDKNPNMPNFSGHHYRTRLRMKGTRKSMSLYYSKGYGNNGAEPTTEEVLNCLCQDAAIYHNDPYQDIVNEYFGGEESNKSERFYKTLERQNAMLENFLDEDFDSLVWQ